MLIYIKLIYNFFSFGKKYLNENNKLMFRLNYFVNCYIVINFYYNYFYYYNDMLVNKYINKLKYIIIIIKNIYNILK